MNRVKIPQIPYTPPALLQKYISNATVYDSSCSPEAKVYLLDRSASGKTNLYLKRAKKSTLSREAQMTTYFNSLSLGAEVIEYVTEDGADWLLTSAIAGEDCTHKDYLSDPKRLAKTTATLLRALHEINPEKCPATNRIQEYLSLAEENHKSGNYDQSHFPDSFGYRSAEEAYSVLTEGKHLLRQDTLIHGDYCLPNIILDNWRLSAFIDVDHGGIGDRHIDIFWGTWTLWFNLHTDNYRDLFLDAYGRDKIDLDALKVVAAAEVFG